MKTRTNLMMTATLALAMAIPAMAGSIWLEFGNAAASKDAAAKGALTTVRATGCHEPEKAVYTATAEGRVDGKRITIPLETVKLSSPGIYALKGTVPKQGTWVISVNSTMNGEFLAGAILPLTATGTDNAKTIGYRNRVTDGQIVAALQP